MKVVSPKNMTEIESLAYRDGALESDFMEEAGSGVALVAYDYMERNKIAGPVILLCGKGNNAGDAFIAGQHLIQLDHEVIAIQPEPIEVCSLLCQQSYNRFIDEGGRVISSMAQFPKQGIIIDGIFGTGFHGSPKEPYNSLITQANASKLPIIAVDIPSGLDGMSGMAGNAIIATETAFLGLPKRGFFFNQGWKHVGKLRYVDFGLSSQYIEDFSSDLLMLSEEMLRPKLPPIIRDRHKYQAGYVVGLSGSPGMPGAAMLASSAALRGGAGIVRLFSPEGMQNELASSPYELIKQSYRYDDPDPILKEMNRAAAAFIGPGIGRSPEVRELLKELLPRIDCPCVIDADALTIIAEENITFPENTILTPHHGEMMRLLGTTTPLKQDQESMEKCRQYAESKRVTLVLKGAPTFIFHPQITTLVNPTGDPGMATAGSGDVLTGLIAALLAQKSSLQDAAALGVYLHGLAGEHAADELTSYGMLASDIIYRFPEAFKFIPI